MRKVAAVLSFFALAILLLNCGGSSRPAGVLLATTQGSVGIDSFGIDLSSGNLTQIKTLAATQTGPTAIVIDPSGANAFVADSGTNSISAYTVNSDGTLTAGSTFAVKGSTPTALAIDHAGKFLFVANQASNNVSVFSVQGSTLSELANSPYLSGLLPSSVTVSPANNYLYVTNQTDNTITVYNIASTGDLSPIPGSPFPTGTAPSGSAIVPPQSLTTATRTYLYVANSGSNNVTAFLVCLTNITPCTASDGSLQTLAPTSIFAAGIGPAAIVVDPTSNFLYIANKTSNQISGYRINQATGGLTNLSPFTVSTGMNPVALVIHPDGLYMYAANISSANISAYKIQTQNGALTALTPISSDPQPAGLAVK